MRKLFGGFVLLCLGIGTPSSFAMHLVQPSYYQPRLAKKKFKLGIELQEISSLCPYMADDFLMQKQPVFFVYSGAEKLWELQIDGVDIEFVTQPFCFDQKVSFGECLESIMCAVQVLEKSSEPELRFCEWVKLLSKELYEKSVDAFVVLQEPKYRFIHPMLQYLKIIFKGNWSPLFAPHVTIQHPLEWSIPLYAFLFQQNSPGISGDEIVFDEAIPLRKEWLFSINEESKDLVLKALSSNKMIGLMFLNAFVMASMAAQTPSTDCESVAMMFDAYIDSGQFDAKMQSALVSRRPFSQMYRSADKDLNDAANTFNTLSKRRYECALSLLEEKHRNSSVGELKELFQSLTLEKLVGTLRDRRLSSFPIEIQKLVCDRFLPEVLFRFCLSQLDAGRLIKSFQGALPLNAAVSANFMQKITNTIRPMFDSVLRSHNFYMSDMSVTDIVKVILFDSKLSGWLCVKKNQREYVDDVVSRVWESVICRIFFLKVPEDNLHKCLDYFVEIPGGSSYRDTFNVLLSLSNTAFARVPQNFAKTDYGEQYYDRNWQVVDLRFMYDDFSEDFKKCGDESLYKICRELKQMTPHEVRVNYLLKNGILTLSMLRNSKSCPDILSLIGDDFYSNVLLSIGDPERYKDRMVLNTEGRCNGENPFSMQEYSFDLLSPPPFLDTESDAMGHYKYVKKIDEYGEAVVEVRSISNIGAHLLKILGLESSKKKFLKEVRSLKVHALKLFDFLADFEERILGNPDQLKKFLDVSIGKWNE